MPHESIIYYGDTAHFPYGDKSEDSIRFYAIKIARFLLQQKCKIIVIACNTASAHAFNVVKEFVGNQVPVINVIDPVVTHVTAGNKARSIGVIGTKGTIKSNIYAEKIKAACPTCTTHSLATPLLAPMIEEGFFNNSISNTIIKSYISKPKLRKIDCLILACTHYPLIKNEIKAIYKQQFELIDSAEIVAKHIEKTLTRKKLSHKSGKTVYQFYVSDYTESFSKSATMFFGTKIALKEHSIW